MSDKGWTRYIDDIEDGAIRSCVRLLKKYNVEFIDPLDIDCEECPAQNECIDEVYKKE